MRILLLTQYLALGGLERMVVSLAQGLARRNHAVWVVAYEQSGLQEHFVEQLKRAGVSVVLLQKNRRFCLKTIFALRRIVKDNKIDLVHSHDLGALIYAACVFVMRLFQMNVVHTQHSFVHLKKGKKRYVFYERLFTICARKICAVSPSIEAAYRTLGVDSRKLTTVRNGILFPSYFMPQADARCCVIRRLPPQEALMKRPRKWLLALGRVAAGKGTERVLYAWQLLSDDLKRRWCLCLLGPVDKQFYEQTILHLQQRLSLDLHGHDSVLMAGPTHEPEQWLFAGDAFISMSEQEGMPLAACEAVGSGLPVLLSDIEGHRFLAPYVRFSPRSAQADSQCLAKFLTDIESNSRSRWEGWIEREQFRQDLGAEHMVHKYNEIYARISSKRSVVYNYMSKYINGIVFILAAIFGGFTTPEHPQQKLSAVLEKPEYLKDSDFSDHIAVKLSMGESRLLTFKNEGFCGDLPQLKYQSNEHKLSVRWFRGVSLQLQHPSYEGAEQRAYVDALVPLEERLPCEDSKEESTEWLFADIRVEDAGDENTGTTAVHTVVDAVLESRMNPMDLNRRWTVRIDVLPIKFNNKMPWVLPLSAELTSYYAQLAHFGRSTDREGELTRAYVRSMVEHRVLPLKSWIKHPFKKPQERTNLDFLLSRDPSPEMSYARTVLSEIPSWASVDLPRFDSHESDQRLSYWQRWQKFFEHMSSDPDEANMQKRMAQGPFVYLWDEPAQEDFRQLRAVAESLQQGAPSVAALVTIYPWSGLHDVIKIFAPLLQTLEREGRPQLGPEHRLWSYVSCMSHGCGSERSSGEPDFVIERNASYIRVWPWMAEHFQLQRVLYYSVNNGWRKAPAVDPWKELWDFSGNGDGTLFYPGREGEYGLKAHTPVPSLRLKLWRQASYDAEYVALAKSRNPTCFNQIKNDFALVNGALSWNREAREYERARDALIACLWNTSEGSNSLPPSQL